MDLFFTNNSSSIVASNRILYTPSSVCGQYLDKYKEENNGQELDIQKLISREGIEPSKGKSKYKGQIRYAPGTIVKNGNYLLMAFAKLDENDRGNLTSFTISIKEL